MTSDLLIMPIWWNSHKNLESWDLNSLGSVDEHTEVLGLWHAEGRKAPHHSPSRIPVLMHIFHLAVLFLSRILYNKPVNVNEVLPWGLWTVEEGVLGNLQPVGQKSVLPWLEIVVWSRAVLSNWVLNLSSLH